MGQFAGRNRTTEAAGATTAGLQRSPGKGTLVEQSYPGSAGSAHASPVQVAGADNTGDVHAKADAGMTDAEIADELEVGLVTVERVQALHRARARSLFGPQAAGQPIAATQARWRLRGTLGSACL